METIRGLRKYSLGWLGAIIVVVAVTVALVAIFARGSGPSDEQAVRAWFETPAGGNAPHALVSAIHVAPCTFAGAVGSSTVLSCPLSTDAPNPTLRTCFVISGGKVLRGGWQLAAVDSCDALRFDPHTQTLTDLAVHAHYRTAAPA